MNARVKEIEARCETLHKLWHRDTGIPCDGTPQHCPLAALNGTPVGGVSVAKDNFTGDMVEIPWVKPTPSALRESAEREKSQQQASEINHEEYQDLCGQFALPKACGCNKNGNDQWCALAPFHEIKRLREREKKLVEAQRWIPVSERLPECDTTPNSFGVPVLVWPPFKSDGCSDMTQAFYGCRQTDEPNFYIFGRVFDPEYWMPLPAPPAKEESHD